MRPADRAPLWRNLLRFSLAFSLFTLAPLLVALGLFEQGWRRASEREERERLVGIRHRFECFIASLDPNARVQKRFDTFRRRLWAEGGAPSALERLWREYRRRWNMPFDPYLFDPDGVIITPRSIPVKSRSCGQHTWNDVLNRPIPKFWKAARRDFIGSVIRQWYLRLQRTNLLPVRLTNANGGMVWDMDPWSNFGGLLLFVWNMPTATDLAQAAFQGPHPPPWPLLALDSQGTVRRIGSTSAGLLDPDDALEVIPTLVRQSRGQGVIWRGLRWMSVTAFDQTWFAGFPEQAGTSPVGRWSVLALLAGLGFLGGRFCWRWIVLGHDRFVSLRLKLISLFLFALLVPAVGGTHLAMESWRDRESIEFSEAFSASMKTLGTIDDSFLEERDRMQRKMRSLVSGDQMVRDPDGFERRLQDMRRNGDFADAYVRDLNGTLIPSLSTVNGNDNRLAKLLPIFAKVCIERAGLLQASSKLSMEEAFVRQIIDDPSSGFGRMVDRPGEVSTLKVMETSEFIYWSILPEIVRPAAYFMATRRTDTVLQSFLSRTLVANHSFGEGAIRVFGVNNTNMEFYPAAGFRHPALRQLTRRTILLGNDRQERITINGRRWLATTRLGRQIDGVTLLALYPEEIIDRRLSALRASAAWVGFAALFIALLTGLVLADTFLLPIGALGAGIAALQRRDTKFRLKVDQKDELGELATAFNALLENFGEVNEAKIIQTELFPRTPVNIGGYAVHGISRPATDLGGDYFDVTELGPGKCFALIGDVSGHGIAAALVMAMARALVARRGSVEVDPADVLADLNQVIHATVQRKRRLMTCAAIWIDTVSHEGRLFGCGHPYPFVRRAGDGRMEILETKGFPLGATAVFRPRPVPFTLEPGDRLFLYTDGLAESLAEPGSDGFTQLGAFIGSRPVLPLEQACEDLLDSHPHTRSGQPQPDDFTMVIIERTPSGVQG